MSAELATLAADPERVEDVRLDTLPGLIGELEALRARLWARLQAPVPPSATPTPTTDRKTDRLLTAKEAAERLGVAVRWMYRKADSLPFTTRLSAGTLRFSEKGLEKWQQSRT